MLASATPPGHSRTVSSRTPNASAIRVLVQPLRVYTMARARSASARSALNPPDKAVVLCVDEKSQVSR
jgi:hypothetical protein